MLFDHGYSRDPYYSLVLEVDRKGICGQKYALIIREVGSKETAPHPRETGRQTMTMCT